MQAYAKQKDLKATKQRRAKQEDLKATRRGAVKSVFEKAGRLKQKRREAYSA